MEIVGFRGGQEGEVISGVSQGGAQLCEDVPQPGGREVGPYQDRSNGQWPDVDEKVFQRVAVEGCHGAGGSPLVVVFVDVPIEERHLVHRSAERKVTILVILIITVMRPIGRGVKGICIPPHHSWKAKKFIQSLEYPQEEPPCIASKLLLFI